MVRSVAGLVMQASAGNLVEVDILEWSRFPCHGVGICHTSMRLVLTMVKGIDLTLNLMRNHTEWVSGLNLCQTLSHQAWNQTY